MVLMAIVNLLFTSVTVACAEENELYDLFQVGFTVHYMDARCMSVNGHELSILCSCDSK